MYDSKELLEVPWPIIKKKKNEIKLLKECEITIQKVLLPLETIHDTAEM
jgi:hypothetical protein